jgi:hypothetical protein
MQQEQEQGEELRQPHRQWVTKDGRERRVVENSADGQKERGQRMSFWREGRERGKRGTCIGRDDWERKLGYARKKLSHNSIWETVVRRSFNRRTFADQQRQLLDNLNRSFTFTVFNASCQPQDLT